MPPKREEGTEKTDAKHIVRGVMSVMWAENAEPTHAEAWVEGYLLSRRPAPIAGPEDPVLREDLAILEAHGGERFKRVLARVSALTAQLEAMTKERDEQRTKADALYHALAVEIKGEHSEECDCLDHFRDAEKLLSGFKSFDDYIDNLYTVGVLKDRLAALSQAQEREKRREEALRGLLESESKRIAKANCECGADGYPAALTPSTPEPKKAEGRHYTAEEEAAFEAAVKKYYTGHALNTPAPSDSGAEAGEAGA